MSTQPTPLPQPTRAPAPASKIRKRSIRRKVSSLFAILITGFLCLLAIIYSSPWGTQAGIALLNKFTDISLTYKDGMFSENIELSKLAYQNNYVDIEASDLKVQFHLRCLWQKQFCIEKLAAHSLSIQIKNTTNKAKRTSPFEMPIAINAKQVSIQKTALTLYNHTVEIIGLNTAVDIEGKSFVFDNSAVSSTTVSLIEIKDSESNTLKTTNKLSSNQQEKNIVLSDIKLPIDLHINDLSIQTLVNNSPTFYFLPPKMSHINFKSNWVDNDLFITSLSSNYSGGTVDINGKIYFVDNYSLDLQLSHQLVNNSYWPETNQSTQLLYLTGDLSQLNAKFKSEGSIELTGNGNVNALKNTTPYRINIDATKIPLYNQVSQHVHPSKLSLTSQGDINNQTVHLNSIVSGLGYSEAKILFKFDHTQSASSTLNNTFNDVFTFEEVKIDDANNVLDLTGSISLGDIPSWDLKVRSKGFTLPIFKKADNSSTNKDFPSSINDLIAGKVYGRIKGNINSVGFYNKEKSKINLTDTNLSGVINNIPFSILGNVDLNENLQLNPSNLTVSIYDSIINFSGYSDSLWDLKGTIDVPEIKQFIPELNGKLSTTFKLTGPIKNPTLNFNNNLTALFYQQLSASLISINGSYSPFSQHHLDTKISSQEIRWLDTTLINFVGEIDANEIQHNVDIQWDGDFKSKLLLNSHLNKQTNNWVGIIAGAELSYLTHHWQPDTDIIIGYNASANQLSLNKHCWKNPGLDVCLTQDVSFFDKGNLPLSIKFNSYYFNKTFAPENISINTNIQGDAHMAWAPDQQYSVTGDLLILAGNILSEPEENYLPVKVLSAWDTGRFTFKVNANTITTDLTVSPDAVNREDKSYDFYADINVKSVVNFSDNFPLSAQLNVDNFSLRPFQSMNHDLALLDGLLSSQVKISGNLVKPKVEGNVSLTQGRLKLIKSPNVLDDVQLSLEFLGSNAVINGAFKIDEEIGSLKGDATWLNEKVLNLHVNAEKLRILVPPQIEATIAPKISATLTENNLKISGSVDVLDGIIRMTKLPEGSIKLTNDVIFVDNQGDEIRQEQRFNIDTDIDLVINDSFQLSGQGFEGNLEGALRVQHNNHQPIQLFGNLNIPNGRYQAYGQRLYIDKGKVAFNGPLENPNIDLRATRTIPKENIKVGIEVSGLVDALSLNLFSSPTLSRAQKLSYLLRGQALESDNDDNSAIGVALGAALANYSGIFKQIDKLPLINNVEIDGDSTQVSIAGYLGKRIYLKYGIGVDEPVNELTVRLFLMSRLWVETISGLESSADIYYSFDTDL